jgi:peptidoglycan biosynthesis protein MviN/MurJ (putative lipid II flippase)
VARAAREMAVAFAYGVGRDVDAFLFVFNLVSWPAAVWFSVLTVVLVPLAAGIQHSTPHRLPQFRAELLGFTLIAGGALWLIASVGLPLLLRSGWTGLPADTAALATRLVPVLALLLPLGLAINLLAAWTMAGGRHLNTALEAVPSMVLFVAILTWPGHGLAPLVWGLVAGFVVHALALGTSLARRGELEAPRFEWTSEHWSPFRAGFGLMLGGQALSTVTTIVDQFFAAHIGTGAIATLAYANRIVAVVLGMGATAVARATLPVFSRVQIQQPEHVRRFATRWAALLFVAGLAAVALAWPLAPWAARVVFERGAFTAADTAAVSVVLRYALSQVPFYFAGQVFVALLVSQRRYGAVAAVGCANLVVKMAANAWTTPRLGVGGLALSTSIMFAVSCTLLAVVVRRDALVRKEAWS